ncbi:MAG: hypothetical protein AAF292_11345 [Pseudomonadota bacterium]
MSNMPANKGSIGVRFAFGLSIVFILLLPLFLHLQNPSYYFELSPAQWGSFLAGAFGGPAFFMIVVSLVLQNKQIRTQAENANNLGQAVEAIHDLLQHNEYELKKQESKFEQEFELRAKANDTLAMQAADFMKSVEQQTIQTQILQDQFETQTSELKWSRIRQSVKSFAVRLIQNAEALKLEIAGGRFPLPIVGELTELKDDLALAPEVVLATVLRNLKAFEKEIADGGLNGCDKRNLHSVSDRLENLMEAAGELDILLKSLEPLENGDDDLDVTEDLEKSSQLKSLRGDLQLGAFKTSLRNVHLGVENLRTDSGRHAA